jgi:hypothetical protein
MSTDNGGHFGTVAFGDFETGIWGAVWYGPPPLVAVGALDPGSTSSFVPADGIAADDIPGDASDWTIAGGGFDLTASPYREPARSPELEGYDQLCRVRGVVVLGGAEREIDVLGRRSERRGVDFGRLDSLRDVSAWFPPDDGVALTALRPRRAHGHGRDLVVASVFDASGAVAVADPRLSTTYAADGSPSRVGLELWVNVSEDSDEQYPRRAAGEALGARAGGTSDGVSVTAYAFRCHSRGSDGVGIYLLARGA